MNSWTSEAYSAVKCISFPLHHRNLCSLWSPLSLLLQCLIFPLTHTPQFIILRSFLHTALPPVSPYFSSLPSPHPLPWLASHLPNRLPGQSYIEAASSWTQMWIFFPDAVADLYEAEELYWLRIFVTSLCLFEMSCCIPVLFGWHIHLEWMVWLQKPLSQSC